MSDHDNTAREQKPPVTALLDVIDFWTGIAIALLLVLLTLDVTAGVVSRYVLNAALTWTEELGLLLFVWLIFVGILKAHRRDGHISMGLLELVLPSRYRAPLNWVSLCLVAYTTGILLFSSLSVSSQIGGVFPALGWPNALPYAIIPISAALSLVVLTLRAVEKGCSLVSVGASLALAALLIALTVTKLTSDDLDLSASTILIVALGISIVFGAPVGFALLASAYISAATTGLIPVHAVTQIMVNGATKFILLAIPLFLLAGYLLNLSDLTTRLLNVARALIGHWRGGLGQVNIFSSLLVGGVSASSSADAAMDSKLLVPQMVRDGYPAQFSCAITAASSILPNIVPPSTSMLIFAAITNVSVAKLFVAGYVPGLVVAAMLMLGVYLISSARGYGDPQPRARWPQIKHALIEALPVFVLPLIILGGIRYGVVTPTEAGATAVLYILIMGYALSRFSMRALYTTLVDAAETAALVGFLLAVTAPIGWLLIAERTPQAIVSWGTDLSDNPYILLLLINLILLALGAFLDVAAAMLIVVPLTFPLIVSLGIDPVHFAMIVIVNLVIGAITPPVGQLVFVTSTVANVPPGKVFVAALPFVGFLLLALLLITLVPEISLALPRALGLSRKDRS